jgi:hypothetical protein
VSETALAFGISWWLVQQVIGEAALGVPDVDLLAPRMSIHEHRYRSVRFFQDPGTKAWTQYEPWMTTIVDLDTGQVLGIVDGRDHKGVGDWLFARPLQWRLGVQVVAIDPSAAFRNALRMWLPPGTLAAGPGPPGQGNGPGLGEPNAAAESRREPLRTRPVPAGRRVLRR